jgi:phosphohistidine phosphatase
MRHGQAEDAILSQDDHGRRLTPLGRDDAYRTALGFISRSLVPGYILCSDARRTRETSDEVIRALGGHAPSVVYDPDLYHASRQSALELLQRHLGVCSKALVIGHNPTLSRLVAYLSGEPVQMDTAEAAHLTLETDDLGAVAQGIWPVSLGTSGLWTLRSLWRR